MSDIAVTFAANQGKPAVQNVVNYINGDEFENFLGVMDAEDPYYEEVRLWMRDLKDSVGCAYLYTLARMPDGTYQYIIDGSCDPDDEENFSALGEEEDLSSWGKEILDVFETGELTTTRFENQEGWGWMISAYEGIKNSSGQVVAVVGCDFGVTDLMTKLRNQILKIIILGLIFIGIGCLITFFFTTHIFGEMNKISVAMEKISDGEADLTAKIPEARGKELSELAQNCNKVIHSLEELIRSLQEQSGTLNDTGNSLGEKMEVHLEQLDRAVSCVNDIDSGTREQATLCADVSVSVDSVQKQIDSLNEKIQDQGGAIQQSSSAIEQISSNISSVNTTVEKITSEYDKLVSESENGKANQARVVEQVATILEESKNLNLANQAIASIASQTNLLAMNAAIEAAHAGEAGKGFGVVADEIRKLAETSSKQSAEIKKLLQNVSVSISQIGESSSISAKSFETVGSRIVEMDGIMKEIRGGMSEQQLAAKSILDTMHILNSTKDAITNAANAMHVESSKLFGQIDGLQKMSQRTHELSANVSLSMAEMKSTANSVIDANKLNYDAVENVIDKIKGFTV